MKRIVILALIITAQIAFSADKPKQTAKPKAVVAKTDSVWNVQDIRRELSMRYANAVARFQASLTLQQRKLYEDQLTIAGQLSMANLLADSSKVSVKK